METAMEPNRNVELIQLAIQKLIDEKKNREASGRSFIEDDDDHLLLSKLLSQLESLKGDGVLKEDSCLAAGTSETTKSVENGGEAGGGSTKLETAEEIVKELKEVKRQNSRTHWLLSAMIVLTVVWQLSEVSLILKLKNSFSHPLKSVGGMFIDMLKGKGPTVNNNNNGHNGEKHKSAKQHQNEGAAAALPPLKMPELPPMDLHGLGLNGEQKD